MRQKSRGERKFISAKKDFGVFNRGVSLRARWFIGLLKKGWRAEAFARVKIARHIIPPFYRR
jgi:hypothetical protein